MRKVGAIRSDAGHFPVTPLYDNWNEAKGSTNFAPSFLEQDENRCRDGKYPECTTYDHGNFQTRAERCGTLSTFTEVRDDLSGRTPENANTQDEQNQSGDVTQH